jgi:hypothetical protein
MKTPEQVLVEWTPDFVMGNRGGLGPANASDLVAHLDAADLAVLPKVASPEMSTAGEQFVNELPEPAGNWQIYIAGRCGEIYAAMVAAAPNAKKPPAG